MRGYCDHLRDSSCARVPWPLLGVAMLACLKTACPRKAVGMARL